MPSYPYVQLDVFTDQPLNGNPLAVFTAPGDLSVAQMQALARETNLSETTFITARNVQQQRFRVRIFTPQREMPFAGHPTLGTAWQLFQTDALESAALVLELNVGDVPVHIEREHSPHLVYFTPPPVVLEEEFSDMARLAVLYGLAPDDFELHSAPAQFVRAGERFLIAPVVSRSALERAEPNLAALRQLEQQHGCALLTLYSHEGYASGSEFATRMFAPLHGVPEDPATGSSASCLTAYLRQHGQIADCGEQWLRLDQGYSIGRPSLIFIRANMDGGGRIDVQIGGHVIPIAQGSYEL